MTNKTVSVPSESLEQQNVVGYLEWKKICYAHTPNEGKRNPVTGNILKRMGMKKVFQTYSSMSLSENIMGSRLK